MKPVFKLDEVVIKNPYQRGVGLDTGIPGIIEAEVMYVGKLTNNYEVGEKILVDYKRSVNKDFDILGEKVLIFSQNHIICGLKE